MIVHVDQSGEIGHFEIIVTNVVGFLPNVVCFKDSVKLADEDVIKQIAT